MTNFHQMIEERIVEAWFLMSEKNLGKMMVQKTYKM